MVIKTRPRRNTVSAWLLTIRMPLSHIQVWRHLWTTQLLSLMKITDPERQQLLTVLLRLSTKSGCYPRSFIMPCDPPDTRESVTCSPSGEIFTGFIKGKKVCLKVVRLSYFTGVETAAFKVFLKFCFFQAPSWRMMPWIVLHEGDHYSGAITTSQHHPFLWSPAPGWQSTKDMHHLALDGKWEPSLLSLQKPRCQ